MRNRFSRRKRTWKAPRTAKIGGKLYVHVHVHVDPLDQGMDRCTPIDRSRVFKTLVTT